MPLTDIGTGATITFGTSSWSATVMAINGNDISRVSIQTSHLSTASYHTKIPGDLVDPGNLELELNFDADNVTTNQPPYNQAAETVTVTFPIPATSTNVAGAKMAASGFMTNFSYGVPLEDKMTANATIELSGVITWTDAA